MLGENTIILERWSCFVYWMPFQWKMPVAKISKEIQNNKWVNKWKMKRKVSKWERKKETETKNYNNNKNIC